MAGSRREPTDWERWGGEGWHLGPGVFGFRCGIVSHGGEGLELWRRGDEWRPEVSLVIQSAEDLVDALPPSNGGEVVLHAPTFHDLRHTHASALIAQGWDIEEVSARLGHANVAVTQHEYVHAFDAVRRSDERRSKLDRLYGNGMETAGRSRPRQTEAPNREDAPDLRV